MIRVVYAASWLAGRRFYSFPHRLYRKDRRWREPAVWKGRRVISPGSNRLLKYPHALLMAMEGRKIVARAMTGAIGEKGYFALLDAEENERAVRLLMDEAIAWQRKHKTRTLAGPVAPGEIDLGGGVLIEGFDEPPALNDAYNRAYYGRLLEKCGFDVSADRLVYRIEVEKFDWIKYRKIAEWSKARFGYEVRYDLWKRPRELAEAVYEIMGEEAEREGTNRLIGAIWQYLTPELCPVVYAEKRPVGVLLTMGRSRERARITTLWVDKAYRGKGVQAVLFDSAAENMRRLGMDDIDASWIDSENLASRLSIERAGGRIVRRYRLYKKQV